MTDVGNWAEIETNFPFPAKSNASLQPEAKAPKNSSTQDQVPCHANQVELWCSLTAA